MDDAIIALALTQIVNLSISKAEFSSPFKLARVVPIHKQAQKVIIPTKGQYLYSNYLTFILERHVNLHLKAYLELNSLFYFRQSGFREHHSCQTGILDDDTSARLHLIEASRSLSWSRCGMVVLIWISEVVFSQGFVKSCLLSGRVGIVSTAV